MPLVLLAALLCAATEPLALPPPAQTVERAAKPRKRPGKPAMTGVLNVNRATEAELRLLPGIGKRRAQLIVERRGKKTLAAAGEGGRIKGMRTLGQRPRSRLTVQGGTNFRPLRP